MEFLQDPGFNIFVVIYMSGDRWEVDTDDGGNLGAYDDLATALDRVRGIREKGYDACLSVVIE